MSSLSRYVPLLLFLGALTLRLVGIDWALPNATRYFSYHPDEGQVVLSSIAVNPWLLRVDPGFYAYGNFPLLVNGLFIHLFEALGLVGVSSGLPSPGAYLVCRMVTACVGAGTTIPLFFMGRMLYGRGAGIAAALFYAITPLPVLHGHFATVDVMATFWVALSLCFAVRRTTPDAGARDLIWTGIFAGLAAATKYNAGLVLLSAWAAWAMTPKGARGVREIIACTGTAFVSFLAAFPAVALNPVGVVRALLQESKHISQTTHGAVFQDTPIGFVYHMGNFFWGMMLVSWVVAVGVGVAMFRLWKRDRREWVLWAFAIPYYILIGVAQVKFARYTLPFYPPLLLMAGGVVWPAGKWRGIGATAGVLCGLTALMASITFNNSMKATDARDLAANYLRERGVQSVGFATGPWFYSPTLNPLFTIPYPAEAKKAASETQNIRLIPADGEWNVKQLRREKPDAVAVTDLGEYGDALRVGDFEAVTYLEELNRMYALPHKFHAVPKVFSNHADSPWFTETKKVTRHGLIRLPVHVLPHDMQYTVPNVVIWTKK